MCGGVSSLGTAAEKDGTLLSADCLTTLGVALAHADPDALALPCEELSTPLLIASISRALTCSVAAAPLQQKPNNVFDSREVPRVPIGRYLQRLQMTFGCCDAAFVGALVVLDRFLARRRAQGQEPQQLTAWNVHRLFLTCLVASVKYNEDCVFGNWHYAKAGGVQLRELNCLERFLLLALDFDLRAHPEQFSAYKAALQALAALGDGLPPLDWAPPDCAPTTAPACRGHGAWAAYEAAALSWLAELCCRLCSGTRA